MTFHELIFRPIIQQFKHILFARRFEAENESDNEMDDEISLSDSFWASKRRLSIFGPKTLPKRHRRQNVVKTSWQMNAA